jgi:hypothetical protein
VAAASRALSLNDPGCEPLHVLHVVKRPRPCDDRPVILYGLADRRLAAERPLGQVIEIYGSRRAAELAAMPPRPRARRRGSGPCPPHDGPSRFRLMFRAKEARSYPGCSGRTRDAALGAPWAFATEGWRRCGSAVEAAGYRFVCGGAASRRRRSCLAVRGRHL